MPSTTSKEARGLIKFAVPTPHCGSPRDAKLNSVIAVHDAAHADDRDADGIVDLPDHV